MKIRTQAAMVLCMTVLLSIFIQGCNRSIYNSANSQDEETTAVIKDLNPTKNTEKHDNGIINPEIIVDIHDYKYLWDDFVGHKYADTTGSATLILDKNGDLYYFGKESPAPVVIMQDVKAFSLEDNSDTLGYTAPFAVILKKNGDLYACGDGVYDTIRDVSVIETIPDNKDISFLEPILINRNVIDCRADYRTIYYLTDKNELYRSKEVYFMLGEEITNPTLISKDEDASYYFIEHQNYNYVLNNTVQMGCGRNFFISVLDDGSVWSCFLPETGEDEQYASGYGEVMGNGSEDLIIGKPICIFPSGTCF